MRGCMYICIYIFTCYMLSWAGQMVSFLATLGMPCDLISPQSGNVSAVVEKLQSSYLESVNACSGVKVQQYLHLRSEVESASYTPAAHISAGCRRMASARVIGTTSNWIALLVGSGDSRSLWDCKSRAGCVSVVMQIQSMMLST